MTPFSLIIVKKFGYFKYFWYLCIMRKASDLKVGDKVIYKHGYLVKESVKVDKPIDDKERPKFLIGRVDLANGDYITNGTMIFDSMEEAKKDVNNTIDVRMRQLKDAIRRSEEELKRLESIKEKI